MEEKKLSDVLGHTPGEESLKQFAVFSARMFYFMARKMLEKLGPEEGAEAVKEAVVEFGRFRGAEVAGKVKAAGLPLTMENEYKFHDLPIGTKIWDAASWEEDGRHVSDVRHCPFAAVWQEMGAPEIGRLYCPIDYAIWEGYNPGITYTLRTCVFNGDKSCVMSYDEPAEE